jgi:NAD(P)-dependent dehydrogenase (short-subunit alcohol dehydrogenase family)
MATAAQADPLPVPSGPVLITGGARGIGLAAARLCAAAGVPVALIDRDEAALERAAAALTTPSVEFVCLTPTNSTLDRVVPLARVVPHACDVRDEHQLRAAFAAAVDELGSLGGVVASAGIDRGGPLHELEAPDWDELLAVNLRGTFLTCREALRHMLPAGAGAIVCMSSPFAVVGGPGGTGAYSASKGGVSALVRALAVEYGPCGIRVNAVLPGPTETDLMWANVDPVDVPQARATVGREVPLQRLAAAEEPARAALWLLSDAAGYVTGAQLACDGGVLAKASVSI